MQMLSAYVVWEKWFQCYSLQAGYFEMAHVLLLPQFFVLNSADNLRWLVYHQISSIN